MEDLRDRPQDRRSNPSAIRRCKRHCRHHGRARPCLHYRAAEQIASQLENRALDALVNVAGIGKIAPMEYVSAQAMQEIFDINVFGQIAVTQAFLPFIRKAHGRIVNISSIGAHIAIPFGGLLNASKSAFGLLTDTLRLELRPFGIRVSTVEPGAISTPAVEKTLGDIEGVIRNLPEPGVAHYADMLRNFGQRAYARESHGSSPDVVARAVAHALTAERPRIRYRVGNHAQLLGALPRILPDRILDAIRMRMLGLPTEFGALERPEQSKSKKPSEKKSPANGTQQSRKEAVPRFV